MFEWKKLNRKEITLPWHPRTFNFKENFSVREKFKKKVKEYRIFKIGFCWQSDIPSLLSKIFIMCHRNWQAVNKETPKFIVSVCPIFLQCRFYVRHFSIIRRSFLLRKSCQNVVKLENVSWIMDYYHCIFTEINSHFIL